MSKIMKYFGRTALIGLALTIIGLVLLILSLCLNVSIRESGIMQAVGSFLGVIGMITVVNCAATRKSNGIE